MPNSSLRQTLALLCLLPAWPAAAQVELRPENLYIVPWQTGASPRVIGLAGAFVSIAERADGISSNAASVAHRHPMLYGNVDFDGTISGGFFPLVGGFDSENVNAANAGFYASFMMQIRRFGLGVYWRRGDLKFCTVAASPCPEYLSEQLGVAGLTSAFSFLDDDLIIGGGLYGGPGGWLGPPMASFKILNSEGQDRGEAYTWNYTGWGLEADLLYRPNGLPFRFGAVYRPEVRGSWARSAGSQDPYFGTNQADGLHIHPLFRGTVTPGLLSLGASVRLGEGARHYNRLSPKAREVLVERVGEARAPAQVAWDAPTGQFLVSMQVDLVFPVTGAASATSIMVDQGLPVDAVGTGTYVVPRLGVEYDTVPGRLRTRAGTWFEPSALTGGKQRAHVAAGLDVRLGRFLLDWSIFGAADFSANSYAYSFGLQAWPGPTPRKPKQQLAREEEDAERRAEEAEQKAEEEEERREAPVVSPKNHSI